MAMRPEDLAVANAQAMNSLDRQSDSLRNVMGISGQQFGQVGNPRGAEHYALDIVKGLPMNRELALDALDRARGMVEAMHKAAS